MRAATEYGHNPKRQKYPTNAHFLHMQKLMMNELSYI